MPKEIANTEEIRRYLRRLGYANERQEVRLPALEMALVDAAGGIYPFLIHQVRDGTLPLEAQLGEKPNYKPWLSWFLVTGRKGHQQVFCEDVLRAARRTATSKSDHSHL